MGSARERGAAAPGRPEFSGFEVVRFGFVSTECSLLGLSLHAPYQLPSRARPVLLIEREAVELLYSPRLASSTRHSRGNTGGWLWRGIFPVPPEVACDAGAVLALRLFGELRIPLPQPAPAGGPAGSRHREHGWLNLVRRGALPFIVSCQLCLVPALTSPRALADGSAGGVGTTESMGEPSPPSSPGEAEKPVAPSPEKPAEPAPEKAPGQPANPPTEAPALPPRGGNAPPLAEPSPSPTGHPGHAAPAEQVVSLPVSEAPSGSVAHPRTLTASARGGGRHSDAPGSGANLRSTYQRKGSNRKTDRNGSRSPAGAGVPAISESPAGPVPGLAEVPPVLFSLPPGLESLSSDPPPSYLVPMYVEAGRRYGVPWQVLAAINEIETDYGRDLSVSSAGAQGWMQFMPATWSEWGVDADHDGVENPYSPLDAIFTAARYLQASGAAQDLPAAIFAYNHAQWYVSEVLMRARLLEGDLTASSSEGGYALPLDRPYMRALGRTDDGVDLELAPDGALVYSITPGVVSAVASDPGGFGPNYPVVEATSGSLAGRHIYYGHVAQALVRRGQHVAAGQPIAVMGHTGDAVSLAHGHIEIGFSDAGGDPLSHHGSEAWTPAGAVMRSFLVTLWDGFHTRGGRAREARKHALVHDRRAPERPLLVVPPAFHRRPGA